MENLFTLFKEHWSEISLAVGAVGTYFLGKKERVLKVTLTENDIKKGELDNMDGALKIYRRMLDDLGKDLEKLNIAYQELYTRFAIATDELKEKDRKILSLSVENKLLIKQIRTCEFNCNFKDELIKDIKNQTNDEINK